MSPARWQAARPSLARRTLLLTGLCCMGLLMAPAVIGCEVDNDYGRQYTGASFDAPNGAARFPQGQAISGQVVNPAALARHGLPGASKGDAVEATWQGGQRFTFTYPAFGRSVTIVFPKDKVVIQSR